MTKISSLDSRTNWHWCDLDSIKLFEKHKLELATSTTVRISFMNETSVALGILQLCILTQGCWPVPMTWGLQASARHRFQRQIIIWERDGPEGSLNLQCSEWLSCVNWTSCPWCVFKERPAFTWFSVEVPWIIPEKWHPTKKQGEEQMGPIFQFGFK